MHKKENALIADLRHLVLSLVVGWGSCEQFHLHHIELVLVMVCAQPAISRPLQQHGMEWLSAPALGFVQVHSGAMYLRIVFVYWFHYAARAKSPTLTSRKLKKCSAPGCRRTYSRAQHLV
jgi:hypothetical protein